MTPTHSFYGTSMRLGTHVPPPPLPQWCQFACKTVKLPLGESDARRCSAGAGSKKMHTARVFIAPSPRRGDAKTQMKMGESGLMNGRRRPDPLPGPQARPASPPSFPEGGGSAHRPRGWSPPLPGLWCTVSGRRNVGPPSGLFLPTPAGGVQAANWKKRATD